MVIESDLDILKMVKHPTPVDIYRICGFDAVFSYSILHLSLLSFMFTYLNIITLHEFAVYPTLMTGNYFQMALDLNDDFYKQALFRFSLIITCTLFGTYLDCYLLIKFQSRENVFAILMLIFIPVIIIVDWISDAYASTYGIIYGEYSLCLLCIVSGALVHWTQKLGYTTTAMTASMFKMAEILFKFINGYDIGGPKQNGEALILFSIFFWSLTGALTAVLFIKFFPETYELIPLLLTIPFNLYFAGCFHKWGWIIDDKDYNGSLELPENSNANISNGNLIQDARKSSSNSNSRTNRLSSFVSVTRLSISERNDCDEIENSINNQIEKEMYSSEN
jgi:uncharacterized membrane protein YoaK (UPF0700 family)